MVSCGKVCDNVSAAPRHVRMAMFFTLRFQVLSAVSNAALDDAFASAVMGKKVCEGRGARCDSCSCSRALLLSQSGAIHEKNMRHCAEHRPSAAAAAAAEVRRCTTAGACVYRGTCRARPLPPAQGSRGSDASSAPAICAHPRVPCSQEHHLWSFTNRAKPRIGVWCWLSGVRRSAWCMYV